MAPGITQPVAIERTISLHGGMNDREKPWILGEFQCVQLTNLEPHKKGARSKRGGVSSIGGKTTLSHGVSYMFDRTLGQQVLIAAYGTEAYLLPGSGQLIQVCTGASLPDTNIQFTEARWNGTNAMLLSTLQRSTDVSLAAPLTALDINRNFSQHASMAPTAMTWGQNRAWAVDNKRSLTDETLWWSQLGDGLSWSAGNTVLIEPGQGGRLVSVLPLRSDQFAIVCFKEDLIALFSPAWGKAGGLLPQPSDALDFVNTSIRIISKKVGCVATGSVRYVPGTTAGDVYFLARDGIRALSRAQDDALGSPSLPVSIGIQDTIDRINFRFAHLCRAEVFDNKYLLTVPLDGAVVNTHTIVQDLIDGAWYLFDWAAADYVAARLTQTKENLWMQYGDLSTDTVAGSNSVESRHTFQCFVDNRDPSNSPIEWSEESRAYAFGDTTLRKVWEWAGIACLNQTATAVVDVYYSVNNGPYSLAEESPLYFPPGGANFITLGVDPLPWTPEELSINTRKISLADVEPGYYLQLKFVSSSDFAEPQIVQSMLAARLLDQEFDNSIT